MNPKRTEINREEFINNGNVSDISKEGEELSENADEMEEQQYVKESTFN